MIAQMIREEFARQCKERYARQQRGRATLAEQVRREFSRQLYARRGRVQKYDARWEEAKHPRDESGKFAETDANASTPVKRVPGAGKFVMADGASMPGHLDKYKIPPAWQNVRISTDPNASVVATGVDAKGRRQTIYSDQHHMRQAAVKFARIREMEQKFDAIQQENLANMSGPHKEAATVAALIMATGIRPGSDRDTGADKQAYGATTLKPEHVKVGEDGSVTLQFTGKKGVDLSIPVTDPSLAKELKRRAASKRDRLFDVNDKQLRDYVHGLDGGKFKPKDFRTHLGTATAKAEIAKRTEPPTDEKSYKKAVKEVATIVSKTLGNTPVVALQSYIDPTVFSAWRPTT